MNYQIFSENEWLYPDTKLTNLSNSINLYSARNADVCFQVLTDKTLLGGEKIKISCDKSDLKFEFMQLKAACVTKNTRRDYCVTDDYESVKDFVTRKAPFEIFDITNPIENDTLDAGVAAFYVRLNISANEIVGVYDINFSIEIDGDSAVLPVKLKIYNAVIPHLKNANFHMVNWIYYERFPFDKDYNVEKYSDKYYAVLGELLKQQVDMRSDYLMVPLGQAIKDENGQIINFDFTHCEKVCKLAFELGVNKVMGFFVGLWKSWTDTNYFLEWDKEVDVESFEAYRQLKLYFTAEYKMIVKNGWQEKFMQCLCDEPQDYNATPYRILASICRKFLPSIKIIDPTETAKLYGGPDIWVVKQATYEERIEEFSKLQQLGEEMWIYACGFPGGKIMNRIMDIPLTVSRLIFWMCFKYNTNGFLHFGYHLHTPEREKNTCFWPNREKLPEKQYSGGNSFIVYHGNGKPIYSVRAHQQRLGSYDFELLKMLGEKNKDKALDLINKVCRTFNDYESSAELFDKVRHQLLESLT